MEIANIGAFAGSTLQRRLYLTDLVGLAYHR